MTEEEALAEARRRWGTHAVVLFEDSTCVPLCLVGVRRDDAEPEWLGVGRTWPLAFEEASLRGGR